MPGDPRQDPFYGTARNLLLAFVTLACAFLLSVHRFLPPRPAVLAVATGATVMALAGLAFWWVFGPRLPAWTAVAAAFLSSRAVMALATGRLFAVRDALAHVYGMTLDLVQTGRIDDSYVYAAYPALHILLAEAHLTTGVPLWGLSQVLSLALGLASLGLVARAAGVVWPGAALPAALGFTVAYYALPPGALYQPMTLAVLILAAMMLIVADASRIAWAPGLFLAVTVVLGLSHPYSSAIVGPIVFFALAIHGVVVGRVRFLIPLAVALLIGLAHVAYVGEDLDRFVELLRPNEASPLALSTPSDPSPGQGHGTPVASGPAYSDAYLEVNGWSFRIGMGLALAGLVLGLFPRLRRGLFLQSLLVVSGGVYLLSRLIAFGFPTRVLTLAAAAEAPLIGLALAKSPKALAFGVVAVLGILSLTAPSAANQFFPWSTRDANLHMMDDPAETAEAVPFFEAIADGAYRRSNPVSSHMVFHGNDFLRVRSFTGTDADPHRAPATHYLYREGTEAYGFAVETSQAGNPQRRAAFVPYPSEGQLAFLDSIDRIGDFGALHVHRGGEAP